MATTPYTILYRATVAKELRKIPKGDLRRIIEKIESLKNDPYPSGAVKLHGSSNLFRIRFGDYRILYEVGSKELTILVIKIGHRREVYK